MIKKPTDKQMKVIKDIKNCLGFTFTGNTSAQAFKFINKNIVQLRKYKRKNDE